ncbi:MAG: hypothetical protein L3J96_00395 [Thermoplasmata archaeon]|nr:hypothetical protein [Thermoplasmata archaeon]
MMEVHLGAAKVEAVRSLPPGQPGREALLSQPDELAAAEFDALIPALIRILRSRT